MVILLKQYILFFD